MATASPPAAIAWAEPRLLRFSGSEQVYWATEFELIPGGSMFQAQHALHGMVGLEVEEAPPEEQGSPDGAQYRVRTDATGSAELHVEGMSVTTLEDLRPYMGLIVSLYRERSGLCPSSSD